MYYIMDDIAPVWEKATIFERESFITRSCAELIVDMCDAGEAKGLEVIRANLASLTEFAELMQDELEVRAKKNSITADFSAICADIESKGFNADIAERLAALSEDVREYAEIQPTAEEEEQADDDAYENIKALIERTALAVGE
ncbi:MAG: hypothetical protein IJS28_06915 [Synergistaceae bacterium]|nr:hypothetical protein [Synergistaceae bacterium]